MTLTVFPTSTLNLVSSRKIVNKLNFKVDTKLRITSLGNNEEFFKIIKLDIQESFSFFGPSLRIICKILQKITSDSKKPEQIAVLQFVQVFF